MRAPYMFILPDCGHLWAGPSQRVGEREKLEERPSQVHSPLEHAPKQCPRCGDSVVSRRDPEGYKRWSESPEKQRLVEAILPGVHLLPAGKTAETVAP